MLKNQYVLKKNEIVDIYNLLKKKPKLKLSSNMVLRTCPLFFKVRNSILKNNMGSIYHIEADYLWGRKAKLISGWRSEAKFYSIIHGACCSYSRFGFMVNRQKT